MPKADPLKTYKQKRSFTRTPEPAGTRKPSLRKIAVHGKKFPIFVIQKHDATRLHYDVRLEAGGVLKSWAVPKGPSFNPKDKRLAIQTEDHPMDYADFEGVIPEGQYGAGPVIVWDHGFYMNMQELKSSRQSVEDSIEAGHVEVWFAGLKMRGGFALTRMNADERSWLLVKMSDDEADPKKNPVARNPESVISGTTVESLLKKRKGRVRA